MAEQLSFEDELVERINAIPFEPFTITAASGELIHIGQRDQVAVGSAVITIFYGTGGTCVIRKNQLVAIHLPRRP